MKAQWKYVVYRDSSGDELIELFGTGVIHRDYVICAGIDPASLISAGFVTADKECFGVSSSLGLSSPPKADTALLRDDD